MKALITGGRGFCGRHLAHYLETESITVFTMGTGSGPRDHYQIDSVHDSAGMISALRELQPDFIFHLAGMVWAESPSLLYRANVEYAAELLGAIEQAGKKGIPTLFVGTAAEYGLVSENDLPVREDHRPRPYNHHGISKCAQTLVGLAAANTGHRLVIARPGNIVGPGMPHHLLLGRIVEELYRIGKGHQVPRIEVGNLDVSRDFIDVEDVSKIYWKLIRHPKAYGEVINVCCGEAIPVRTLVERLIEMSGIEAELAPQPTLMRTHDPVVYFGSTVKLSRFVDSVPRFEINRTLRSILDYAATRQ
jgi:GDP-4-dehydro-6-deoxy-D-mannose reductase